MARKYAPTEQLLKKRIMKIRPITKEEAEKLGWKKDVNVPVFELDNGVVLMPVVDPEASSPAVLYGSGAHGSFVVGISKNGKIYVA